MFWLKKGVFGFRVDMAPSVIKGGRNIEALKYFWDKIIGESKKKYADLYEKSDLGKELELTIAERSHNKSLYRQNHDAWEGVFDD